MPARLLNVLLGATLLFTVGLWPHTHAQQVSDLVAGFAIVVAAASAAFVPRVRRVTAVLGFWVFISALIFTPRGMGTFYVDLLVGSAVMLLSFAGGPSKARYGRAV